MLHILKCARAKLGVRLNQEGQAVTEYVLLILGTVLFLIAAAFVLRGSLNHSISAITSWIVLVIAPAAP
jgi:uncharacterized protein (UPF0333 family)